MQFFIRMWSDSGATGTDFNRVASLVASQYVWEKFFSTSLWRLTLALESRLPSDAKTNDHGTKSSTIFSKANIEPFVIDKCASSSSKMIY